MWEILLAPFFHCQNAAILCTFAENTNNLLKLSNKYFVTKNIEKAFDLLFNNYAKSKEKEKIKKAILNYFEALGNENNNTKIYRRKLSSILFA